MPALVALLRGPRAGGVLLAILLALSVGVPAFVALSADDGGPVAGDGPSLGVLSTAALSGLPRLLLADSPVHIDATLPAASLVPKEGRPAGEAPEAGCRVEEKRSHGDEATTLTLRI